jgi:2-methylcitrate dehydratase PrpD
MGLSFPIRVRKGVGDVTTATQELNSAGILAEHVAGLHYADLREETRQAFRRVLADYVACVLSGADMPTPQLLRDYLKTLGEKGVAGALGTDARFSAPSAAMANGAAAHALDFDDGHTQASAHPGGAVLSAALALAEETGTLVATVAGYEVMLRVAMAMHPASAKRGWHNTAVAGVFGAAAASASLLNLDAEKTRNALGLATSFAGGIREYLDDGSEVKRIHPGKAARDGIVCASLADRGLTGAVNAFEGRHALLAVFIGDKGNPARLTDGLGEHYEIENAYFKPYPCCRHFHSVVDGVLALREQKGIGPDDLEHLVVGLYAVGKQGHDHIHVGSLLEAQMSAPFAAATALKHGAAGVADFDETARADPEIAALSKRIDVVVDDACEAAYPAQRSGSIRLQLKSGETLSAFIRDPKGEGENALSDDDLRTKLEGGVTGSRLNRDAGSIWNDIMNVDQLPDIQPFLAGLQLGQPT